MSTEPDLKKLAEPFPEADIEWRVSQAGGTEAKPWIKVLAYINARAVMDRLDEACGPGNWKQEYHAMPGGVMCALSIRVGGEWITKHDGSDETDVESFKGAISGALKRAAVSWGIGRYLYNLPGDQFAFPCESHAPGARWTLIRPKTGQPFETHWVPPKLPMWALTEKEQEARRKADNRTAPPRQAQSGPTGFDPGPMTVAPARRVIPRGEAG